MDLTGNQVVVVFLTQTKTRLRRVSVLWLGDQDYSPLRGSPLRGRLRRSNAQGAFVEPEVLIPVPLKQKPA